MASGTTIAKGYVQIVPSAKGIKGSIQNILNEEAGTAGNTAGEVYDPLKSAGRTPSGFSMQQRTHL